MEILDGTITRIGPEGITVLIPSYNLDRACLRQYSAVQVGLPDGRTISPEQRKKAHAILHDIAEWQEGFVNTAIFARIKTEFKLKFIVDDMQALEKKMFSLSDCDMTLARDFITYLVDFAIEWSVPCKEPLWKNCEDVERYVIACLKNKVCAICGKDHADLHHWDAIGMGNDRTIIYQIGWPVIPLCRVHHGEAHSKGVTWLKDTLHLEPVALTVEIGKVYGLTKKNLQKEE